MHIAGCSRLRHLDGAVQVSHFLRPEPQDRPRPDQPGVRAGQVAAPQRGHRLHRGGNDALCCTPATDWTPGLVTIAIISTFFLFVSISICLFGTSMISRGVNDFVSSVALLVLLQYYMATWTLVLAVKKSGNEVRINYKIPMDSYACPDQSRNKKLR